MARVLGMGCGGACGARRDEVVQKFTERFGSTVRLYRILGAHTFNVEEAMYNNRNWHGISMERFIEQVDEYIRWYDPDIINRI